jgi:hypothetical protein
MHCFSRPQAEAITEEIDCAIGMTNAISDDAAITFAASFYRAIGFGRSVKHAFDQGKTALLLEGMIHQTPDLITRKTVAAESIVLITHGEIDVPGYDRIRQQDDQICTGYIDEWARRCDLDGWTGWSSFVLGADRTQMTVARDHELEELRPWLLGRVWPARYPTVERAFVNFRVVLQDFQNTFRKHAEKPTPDNDWLLTVKFYQIKEWDKERQERLFKAYSFHVYLVMDLMLELTRAANLIADEVRSSIMPTFRLTQGHIMVESGPHSPGITYQTFAVHYRPEEKAQPMPYPGLGCSSKPALRGTDGLAIQKWAPRETEYKMGVCLRVRLQNRCEDANYPSSGRSRADGDAEKAACPMLDALQLARGS